MSMSHGAGPDLSAHLDAFPILSPADIEVLSAFGSVQSVEEGEILFNAGEQSLVFYVILEGEIEIVRPDDGDEVLVVVLDAGRFVGELSLLTGQRRYLTARVRSAGRLLAVPPDEFRRLLSSVPDIADRIFAAMLARREVLRTGEGARSVRIIGSRYSPEALALRAFAARSHLPHTWVDLEDEPDVETFLASMGVRPGETPVVITVNGTLRQPTPGEFAEHLGLTYQPIPGFIFDLVVVGTGPGGLAAAVYGASEGLRTISLDAVGVGGQAGSSSRIENYAGFPTGISGEELATRTAVQAQRLGATLNAPCEVVGMAIEEGFHVVKLSDGSEIPCRAVIVASGARYRRLDIDGLDRFEGAGVYYAATDLEVRACGSQPVVVVGGGNSAGQAAIYLAQNGSRVSIAIRREDLTATMSTYLIDRIEAHPDIEVRPCTEVGELVGDDRLGSVVLVDNKTGTSETLSCAGVFCFIGAEPATGWLGDCIELDERGFVLTDRSLSSETRAAEQFAGREPFPFETSAPGIFAVGDVRNGSLKRVAAAVGEGSSAVRSVHDYLAISARPNPAI